MSLSPGNRVGTFEIVAELGAGGMGVVYRARDTKLNRDVALKVLPDLFAADAERLARFKREAQVLASLNHPNIAAIHGFEETNGVRALVLELVEGVTLAERIALGPVPIEEALPIARQIADALDAAHEHGVVHRDLKPANIKVRQDGTVKVLDFGLAKLAGADGTPVVANAAMRSNSPTITSPALMTGIGVLLGTAAYISPEQAKGQPADKRSDIWAFGCVLYEMLTGRRAFNGDDVAGTLANVLKTQPDWTALPRTVPIAVQRLLHRCLEKDRRERLRDVADARLELRDSHAADTVTAPAAQIRRLPQRALIGVTAAAAVIGTLAATWVLWTAIRPVPAVTRLSVAIPDPARFDATHGGAVAISPDGRTIVFVATGDVTQLFARRLDDFAAAPIAGTEGAASSFFSPDGQWIGFQSGNSLKKIRLDGGGAMTICRVAGTLRGAAWGPDDTIYFGRSTGGPLLRVAASGGMPGPATQLAQGEFLHRWPQVTRDGRLLILTALRSPSFDTASTVVQRLDTGERATVVEGGTTGRYLESGHLAYVSGEGLLVLPFDVRTLRTVGQPVRIVPDVRATMEGLTTGGAEYAVSENGTLVYAPGGIRSDEVSAVWVDRTGAGTPLPDRAHYVGVALSPDDRQVAFALGTFAQSSIWIYDLTSATMNRLTFDGVATTPLWSPDGQRIVYSKTTDTNPRFQLYWKRADGTGREEPLATGDSHANHAHLPRGWTPDGRFLFMNVRDLSGFALLDVQSGIEKPVSTRELLPPDASVTQSALSPDGKWLAYVSNFRELYVQAFPSLAGRWQLATGTGVSARWNRDGKEIFYWDGPSLMAASVSADGNAFRASKPTKLFDFAGSYPRAATSWGVSADGRRFLLLKQAKTSITDNQLHVVTDWFQELNRLAPSP